MEKFYITTAIAYTSKIPHIGNTYEAVVTDAISRYKKLNGYDVYFLTGTDEHGQKIQQQATEQGIKPKEHVDLVATEIRRIWDMMNVEYDQFIRTTDDIHVNTVQKIFKKLYDQGDIYKGSYEGLYCVPCESFFTESQLVDGKCPDCGREVEKASEEAYFFKLSKYADRLIKHIEENPDFISPTSRKNEMLNNFLKPGLQDLCVSRTSFNWGIPVNFDNKHVVYVWMDALTNYISALGYDPYGNCSDKFKKYWPADVHVIGKDIVRFHTIYWPIFLLALDEELPKKVYGHPWLLTGVDKMSKSRGNVIYAQDLVDMFGVDPIRYYLLREMPFAQDGTLTYEMLVHRLNTDLANILGNLVSRTIAMVDKYFEGVIPEQGELEDIDNELIAMSDDTVKIFKEKMDQYMVAEAIEQLWELLRRSNKYIDETCPWILAKDENKKDRLGTVLYNLLEVIRITAVLIAPIIPETSAKIKKGINTNNFTMNSLEKFDGTNPGDKVKKIDSIFNRIDEKKFFDELKKSKEKKEEKKKKVQEEEIIIDDFNKVKIQVAKIIKCEKVEKADKLLKFRVSIGSEERTVVSGLAKQYSPEELINKKVLLVSNLKPVKLKGILSEGMLLTTCEKKIVKLVEIDENVPEGTPIK